MKFLTALGVFSLPIALMGFPIHFVPEPEHNGGVLFVSFPEGVEVREDGFSVDGTEFRFPGASPSEVVGIHRTRARFNYVRGNDPSKWRTGVRSFYGVMYSEIYPSVDVALVGTGNGEVEIHWILRPGGDPSNLRLVLSGSSPRVRGGKVEAGRLVITSPKAFQGAEEVSVRVSLRGDTVIYSLGRYDRGQTVVLDPILDGIKASTFYGGDSSDGIKDMAVSTEGVFVVGFTSSSNLPTLPSGYSNSKAGDWDVFVARFDPSLGTLMGATYVGGSGFEVGTSVSVGGGKVTVGGYTFSGDFPITPTGWDNTYDGNGDGFVLQLDTSLSVLLSSTYVGGNGYDEVMDVAHTGSGIIVMGNTASSNLTMAASGYDHSYNGGRDVFLYSMATDLSSPSSSTFLGGSGFDKGEELFFEGTLSTVTVVGWTSSSNFPTFLADDYTLDGPYDAFVSSFNVTLNNLGYSTYFGGSGNDRGYGVHRYLSAIAIVGWTNSPDMPLVSAMDSTLDGPGDGFIALFSAGSLALSSYLGGGDNDVAEGVVKHNGLHYVVGHTGSADLPFLNGYDTTFNGVVDGFVMEMSLVSDTILSSTYVGGGDDDVPHTLAFSDSVLLVAGETASTDYPTLMGFGNSFFGGGSDAFITAFGQPMATELDEKESKVSIVDGGLVISTRTGAYVGATLYSQDGRRVKRVSLGYVPKGRHVLKVGDLDPGTYVCVLRVGKTVKSFKVILL